MKKMKSYHFDIVDGSGGHYVKRTRSNTERQTSHVFTSLWKLKVAHIKVVHRLTATTSKKGKAREGSRDVAGKWVNE